MALFAIARALGAGKLVKKAASWVGKRVLGGGGGAVGKAVGKAVSVATRHPILTAAAGTAAGGIIQNYTSGAMSGAPPLPSNFQGRPASLPTRIGQRLVPGGKTGREFTPYEGAEQDRLGRAIAVYPETRERLYAPPGYVIVRPWGPDGDVIAMLKGPARAMGLWHPDPKPPVSGWDMRAITRANSAKKRVKKLGSKVGLTLTRKK